MTPGDPARAHRRRHALPNLHGRGRSAREQRRTMDRGEPVQGPLSAGRLTDAQGWRARLMRRPPRARPAHRLTLRRLSDRPICCIERLVWVACRDPPVESSSRQADIEPSRPVRHDGSLRPRGRPTLPSLRPIGLRRVDSKAPCGASSPSCRRPPTLSRSHRDALPRVCNEPPEASNIQCFRDGRPRARLGRSRQEILDTTTLKAQHSCRFAGRSSGRLLIRRSLVRAQVGEPKTSEESSAWSNADRGRAADGYWKPPISSGSALLTLPGGTHSFSWEKQHAVAVFLAPASDGRRSEATFAGIETGTALMLMPMVLAQLPAAGKPSKDLQRPNAS